MHCELVVPGLLSKMAALRLPSLELLLARGRSTRGEPKALESWLHQAFQLDRQPLAAGALTLLAANGDPGEGVWLRADPVHLRLLRDRAVVVPAEALAVSAEEAASLCDSLGRHFRNSLFKAINPRRWCARVEKDFPAGEQPSIEAAGHEVMPARETDPFLNEAQMLLHAHPVNEAREARGEPAINSLWLWGAGRSPKPAGRWDSVLADEPIALALARLAGARHRALPAGADAWLERAPEEGRHLVILDSLRAPLALSEEADYRERLERLERDWFAPLLGALRAGRVGMATVHVPDGDASASFETIRGDLRRFWRRPKALESYT